MKTLHTIYTSFAKRLAIILTLLLTLGVTFVWGETYEAVENLTDGKSYILVANKKHAITAKSSTSNYIDGTDVSSLIDGDKLIATSTSTDIVWVAKKYTSGSSVTWSFKNASNYIQNNSGSTYRNMTYGTTESKYSIKNSKIYSTGTGATDKWLQYNTNGFRMYSSQQGDGGEFVFYELTESCTNSVSVSAGSKTNVNSISFSSSSIATCSLNAADRQVTVTVTPNTGYEMTSSARLTFTKTSGTATATYVSGPTASGSAYQFVYQFNQNDNGEGAFSASCTAKTSTISFNQNGGEGGTARVTATYGQNMPTPITLPTRYGHTFGGYYDGAGGTGTQYYKPDGTSARTWNKTSANITLYAQWTEKSLTNYRTTCTEPSTFTVTYNANDATSGSVPEDNTEYAKDAQVTVLGNTGNLAKTGYTFSGWNTEADGSGNNYAAGATFTITENTTLYAKWTAKTATSLTWSPTSYSATIDADNTFPELTVEPEAIKESVQYTSSDKTIATIDANGTITLLKAGTTTITASYDEDEDYLSASASYTLTVHPSNCRWIEVTDNTTLEDGDEVVITMTDALSNSYTLLNEFPEDKEVPDAISISSTNSFIDDYIWIVGKDGENLTFESYKNRGNFLRCNNADKGIRIDNTNNATANRKFVVDDTYGYLKNIQTTKPRYLGVHNDDLTWFSYALTDKGNFPTKIVGQTLKFYKKECIASDEYWIIYNLENVTCNSEKPNYIGTDGEIELYFSANSGYKLPEQVSITMGGLPLSEDAFAWEAEEGLLYIIPDGGITGNLVITIEGCELLAIPTNLKANNITSSSATLSWDEIDHATEYQVHITDDDDSTEDIITTTSNTYYEVTGLSSASEYLWGITPIASGYCGLTQEAEIFTTLDVHTVTFNTNGGTAVEPQNIDHGGKAAKPTDPTKTGYKFVGWYTEADTEFNFNTPIESATPLYAKWNANQYTITFRQQWGNGGTETATVHFDNNDFSVSPIIVPTRNGYTFGGYYTSESGAGTQLIDVSGAWLNASSYIEGGKWVYADNLKLYAKWTQNFTITWMANGQPYHSQTAMMGTAIAKPDDPDANEFACNDKVFVGWLDKTISGSTNEEPTFVTDFGTIQAAKTYHAVFATLTGTPSNDYNKITNINDLTDGEYVIAYSYDGGTQVILKNTTKDAKYMNASALAPSSNKYTSPSAEYIWQLQKQDDGSYYMYNSSVNKFLYATTSALQLSDNPTKYNISYDNTYSHWKIKLSDNASYYMHGYVSGSSYDFRVSTSGSGNKYRVYLYKNASTAVYSNYVTTCVEIPTPHWEGAEIDNANIAVDCGAISFKSNASKITFDKNYDLTYPITLTASEGFLLSTNKQNDVYEQSVTVTPVQSDENKGKITQLVHVRADATGKKTNFDGTITISGDQLAEDQIIEVHAVVDCPQYTLTFNDCGNIKTITDFAGTSVEEMEPWAETCSEPFQYVFDGWATAPVTNGTEEYEQVDFSKFTMPNNNTTILYAVYRYAEEGGEPVNGYVKVTEALSDWSGDYVIVDDENLFAIKNAYRENTSSNKTLAGETVTIENDKVVSPSANIVWTFSKNGDGYTMYSDANKMYAGVTSRDTRKAILSSEVTDDCIFKFIFDNTTYIAKVSAITTGRCFQYYVNEGQKEWRTYDSNQSQYNTGYLYRLSNKTIRYTSSLVCGTIEAEDALVTSTKDQKVKVKVPITLNYSEAASITGTSDNEAFTVVTKNNVAVGESNIEVHYKPTAYVNTANQEETATITLTTSNGATTIFNVTGRCLPETFAIVAKVGNVWYALPSQGLNSETTPVGYPVEVDNNDNPTAVTAVPANADWSLRQVYASSGSNDRFADNGEKLVFVNDANPQKALNAGSTGNYLLTDARYDGYHTTTTPGLYEWTPTTTDLKTYTLTNVQRTDRTLNVATNTVFGVHSDNKATTEVRFLRITGRYTPAALQVVEWKENSVVIMYNGDPAQTASVTVNAGAAQETTLSSAQKDIAVYELAANGLATNPTQSLSITIGSEKVILPIPYIVGGDLDDATLLGGDELTIARRQEIAKISDLVILNGGSVTAERISTNYYKFRNVTIYGGGSLIIPAGKGFGANTLTMRVGGVENRQYKNLYPQLQLKGTLTNTSGQINLDYLTTNDFYYPLSVPYSVTIAHIQYPVDIYGANVASDNTGSFQFKYYDGAERAAGKTGWIVLDETANPTLNPNTGYAIWGIPKKVKVNGGESTRQKFGIHRLPLKQTAANMMTSEQQSHSATINVYNGSKRDSDNGWNYLGNPYLSHYGVTTDDKVMKLGKLVWNEAQGAWLPTDTKQRYVVFTNDCQNYIAELASNTAIPAFSAFFIQADQGGAINFTSPNVATPQSLAARHSEEESKEITTGIILSGEKHLDRTGLLIADQFTEAYEFNADLSKFDNQDMNLYTISSSGKLAFMAINEDLAKQTIPLGYSVSTDGMYTIAFDEQRYSRNDIYALYLIDYDRNETTNLLHMDYDFYSDSGASAERFALQVAFAPSTTTDIEYTQVGDILVSREGNTLRLDNLPSDATVTVYDAVGHLVEQHTASQLLQLTLQKGYYLLHIGNNQNSVVIDTFIP